MPLPLDKQARNDLPIWTGLIMYFPDVWAEVVKASVVGNKQHQIGEQLRWDPKVSPGHMDKLFRHSLDHAQGELVDHDGVYHMAKAIWRACAELQETLNRRAHEQGCQAQVEQKHADVGGPTGEMLVVREAYAQTPPGWTELQPSGPGVPYTGPYQTTHPRGR